MNTTFKKTLIAAALAAVSTGALAAADVTGTTAIAVSKQGNLDTITVPAVEVVLGAEYAVGDVLTFTFSGAALDPDTLASTIDVAMADVADSMTLGLLEASSGIAKYRVTELNDAAPGAAVTVGATVTLDGIAAAGLDFVGEDVFAAGGVTLAYSAVTGNNQSIDSTGNDLSTQVIYVADEVVASVDTALNSIIDVEDDRKLFTVNAADELVFDTLLITGADTDTTPGADLAFQVGSTVTVNTVSYTVNGDFSWVQDTAAGTPGIQAAAGTFVVTNCAGATAPVVTATSVSFSCTAGAANTTLAIDPKQAGAAFPVALNGQAFSADVEVNYDDANGDEQDLAFEGLEAGSWTLNGSQVRVPYMVVGGNRFGIIANVTNHGSRDGAITLDVFAEDGSVIVSNYAAGTAVAGSVTSVAPALIAALGGSPATTTKFSFQITTNVPENDVIVYAAYTDNTTSERAIVNNDSKVQTK